MTPELQELEISSGEIRHLSGVDVSEVFRPSILTNPQTRWVFLFQELLLILALTPMIVGLLHVFVILPLLGTSLGATIFSLIAVPIAIAAYRWLWWQRGSRKSLGYLLDEVDRYNATIKAIDIHDRLQATRTQLVTLSEEEQNIIRPDSFAGLGHREHIIAAMTLIKQDLVSALQAERILRENKSFLVTNPELLTSNLRTLQTLQIQNRASEYGHLFNEALQIATDVSLEMRKLQSKSR
ncbi:MAG TPA: hypothetical protein DEG17_16615 [Cyanobacteria bacterium UBA11149]|nr:hypothetical protein [Cyanobacteria bacterium UBA11367]HBE59900.1 hypothetical protein [Cyanobacteria bacterium UBA11366]HBK63905.1 hypothetical protein [Cyanobacteria bacterium UBA11166]HBR75856.1 hypothetical protein [Cyanobacteria bacterium UBA11159]HBS69278.1 hypothetical protein [Cyanobacteria bacterium UBA11153]HBW90445.1 hypothetical protein [Cyanobacteria bacterium UBA11149]HCA96633.1 hypothetical protein [Cyanobacteria bacterium UBA9226]